MKTLFAAIALFGGTFLIMRGGPVPEFRDLFNGKDLTGWVNVNTAPDTWKVKDGTLICSGHPIGVMRSDKQYEGSPSYSAFRALR